jgi:hypothetical protein
VSVVGEGFFNAEIPHSIRLGATTTAGLVAIGWDHGGSGSESFSLFDRNAGAVTQQSIVRGIMKGVKNGLAAPNAWATVVSPRHTSLARPDVELHDGVHYLLHLRISALDLRVDDLGRILGDDVETG